MALFVPMKGSAKVHTRVGLFDEVLPKTKMLEIALAAVFQKIVFLEPAADEKIRTRVGTGTASPEAQRAR